MLEARRIGFHRGQRAILADIDLAVRPGEVVGLDGASGSGKSTLGRVLAGYLEPSSGSVSCDGRPVAAPGFRPVQYVAQAPLAAMNPHWRIGRILAEGGGFEPALAEALGVETAWHGRFAHQLSGGQQQRVALVRALNPQTRYLILDEITAALDPISQAQLWPLVLAHAARRQIGLLAISHDAALLARIATRRIGLPAAQR